MGLTRRELLLSGAATALTAASFSSRMLTAPEPTINPEVLKAYIDTVTQLDVIADGVEIADYISPLNADEERRKFLDQNTAIEDPKFEYQEAPQNKKLEDTQERIRNLEIPDLPPSLAVIVQGKIASKLNALQIVQSVGVKDITEFSAERYGKPDDSLIEDAKTILEDEPALVEEAKTLSSHDIEARFKLVLERFGFGDWTIEKYNQPLCKVQSAKRTVYIPRNRKYSDGEINRLCVHELGVHAVRGENGALQPLPVFQSGFPGYITTEEGLAAYAEKVTRTGTANTLRMYAGRVLAVHAVLSEVSFSECVMTLIDQYRFDQEMAWGIVFKAYRGSTLERGVGFIRDHIYLQGLREIEQFVEAGGDLRELYVGKIGIGDLALVTQLKKDGLVEPPKYYPEYLSS